MSKGSLFWANARGKLGESVFYRAGGEQRNRTYVKNIKNPKTLAQAEQRLSMLNFSAGYRALRSLLEFSFPNRPSNLSGFNAFVKANKSTSFPVIDRAASDEGLAVLGDAVVSQGSITAHGTARIEKNYVSAAETPVDAIAYFIPVTDYEDDAKAAIFESLAAGSADGLSLIDTPDKVKSALSYLGLPSDTVINVVKAVYEDEGYRYSISTYSATAISNALDEFGVTFGNFDGEGTIPPSPSKNTFGLGVVVPQETSDETYYAIILSYKQNDKVDVTNSRLIPVGSSLEYTNQFRKGGEVYEQIMANYGPSMGNILAA